MIFYPESARSLNLSPDFSQFFPFEKNSSANRKLKQDKGLILHKTNLK